MGTVHLLVPLQELRDNFRTRKAQQDEYVLVQLHSANKEDARFFVDEVNNVASYTDNANWTTNRMLRVQRLLELRGCKTFIVKVGIVDDWTNLDVCDIPVEDIAK